MKRVQGRAGFTLVEMMWAFSFAMLMTVALLIFVVMFRRLEYEYGTTVKLANQSRIILEKMIWSTRSQAQANREGIWEAQNFTVVSPTQLQYTDINGTVHTLRQNGLKIETRFGNNGAWVTLFDANGAAIDDPGSYATTLNFQQVPNLNDVVQIRLVLGQRVVGRWYYASLSTQIFTRN